MDSAFLFMMLALKIPIAALCLLVWWAIKQEPDTVDHGGDGGTKVPPARHPRRPLPRHPRRGPHGDGVPLSPPRVRSVVVKARATHSDHV